MECVSLFSGAGGLDLGFRAAGFSIAASVERDADCCATLRSNGLDSVNEMSVEQWLDNSVFDKSLSVIFGGPPCQPFSKSAYWCDTSAKGLRDARANCVSAFMSAVEKYQPICFLMENVPGFVTAGGVDFVEQKLSKLREDGLDYHFTWQVLNCAEYGVPQKRQRFFGVGSLVGKFEFPRATHLGTPITAWDALHCLKPRSGELQPKGRWADLLPTIPEGENYLWHTARGGGQELFGWRTRYWSFLQKLSKFEPAPTIVASPAQDAGPFHWSNRHLSTSELAALQTFPRSFKFIGNRSSQRRQIGNAVPPLMSELLARALSEHIGQKITAPLRFTIAKATRRPIATRAKRIPKKFEEMIGARDAHPGTGRGPKPRQAKLRAESVA